MSFLMLGAGSNGSSAEPPAALDGEVTSAAEILAVAANAANAGKSYYMRGGSYGSIDFTESHRPASTITFLTYPGEQVRFTDVTFFRSRNLKFDGNSSNRTRAAAGGYPDGSYGLWLRGSGITGFDIPSATNILTFEDSGPTYTDGITFANFRIGDDASTNEANWRCQHGIVIGPWTRNLLFEDFELGYIGGDLADFDPVTGAGDVAAGGFGVQYFGSESENSGAHTFRRGHFHHTMNDFCQYGPDDPTGLVLFEECLFEELTNFGDAHADIMQLYGTFGASGAQPITYEGCVFRNGTDFLLHGDKPGGPRTFSNCLFGMSGKPINNPTFSKDNEGGPTGFVIDSCSMEFINSFRCDSTAGAAFTSDCVVKNSIYPGISTITGIVRDNVWTNSGEPNVVTDAGTGVSGDTAASPAPTYNSQGECTNYSQGWRKPGTFPWTL
jgi:hypothetical protein